jgi:hypothetical protein
MRSALVTASPVKSSINWAFRSRQTGRITIAQWPNLALVLFAALRIAAALTPQGAVRDVLTWAARAALAWWAVRELFGGVNPFRRFVGVVVLAGLLLSF